ncbi:MAG: cytochrome c biogenesis protein CcdA [Planctomycetota bacterium]
MIAGTFAPKQDFVQEWHLYSIDLPREGVAGAGRPTLLEVPAGQALQARGAASIDAEAYALEVAGVGTYPVYPAGPVQVRLPVTLPQGDGAPADARIRVVYQACSDASCRLPVETVINVTVPSDPDGAAAPETTADTTQAATGMPPAQPTAPTVQPAAHDRPERLLGRTVAAPQLPPRQTDAHGMVWYTADTRAGVKAVLAHAAARDRATFIDFSAASCAVCKRVHATVFPLEPVTNALKQVERIVIDLDHAPELAAWQQQAFGTVARPFYVRVDPDGEHVAWHTAPTAGDADLIARFADFIAGGAGQALTVTLLAALFGGLAALLMPCTYPMIPLTIGFFAKQAEGGRRLLPLAGAYAAGIMVSFTALGLIIAGLLGSTPGGFAGNPWTNLVIGLIFAALGLSLLGAYSLRLPGFGSVAGSRGGYLGALSMGLTFAIAAFACTTPIVGVVLGQAVSTGDWWAAIVSMLVFSGAIAVPIFFLALSPSLLQRLPRAGGWMNEFKLVAGLVVIATALHFFAISDSAWNWGLLGSNGILAIWAAIALAIAAYVLGWIRTAHDTPVERVGLMRLFLAIAFTAIALYLAAGLTGAPIGPFAGLV